MSETYDTYEDWEDEGQDSPLALVGMLVMVLTSAAIMANALFMQPKSAEIDLINKASKQTIAQEATNAIAVQPKGKPEQTAALQSDHTAMTLAVQRQLTMAGYYVGPLDGREGTQTREAILAYQDAMGMPATGRVSLALHDVLTGRKSYTPSQSNPVEATKITNPPVIESVPSEVPTIAALPKIKPANLVRRPAPQKRIAVTPPKPAQSQQLARGPVPPADIPAVKSDPTLQKVQSALTRFGYGQLKADGLMGAQTRAAISAFQRSRGHPVTGTVNDRLLQEMMIMGYLDLG